MHEQRSSGAATRATVLDAHATVKRMQERRHRGARKHDVDVVPALLERRTRDSPPPNLAGRAMTAERRSDSTRLRRLCHAEKSSAWQAIRSCCIGPAARRCAGTSSPGLRPTAAIEAQHVKRCGGRTKPLFCYSVGMDLFQESCQVGVSSIACAQQSLTHRSCVDEQSRQPSSCNRCATSIHFRRHVSCARPV